MLASTLQSLFGIHYNTLGFSAKLGVEDDKNFIPGAALLSIDSIPGGALAGGERIVVRLTAGKQLFHPATAK